MKNKISVLIMLILVSTTAFPNDSKPKLVGINSSNPVTNPSGLIVETEFLDPLADFILLENKIAEEDMLNDIPGRIVAFCETSSGTNLIPYGNIVLKNNIEPPKIKNDKLTFDSFLIDTKSAAKLGFVVGEVEGGQSYRVEYNLFKGPTASIRMGDIDSRKFTQLSKGIGQKLKNNKECNLKDVLFIESATIIYQNFKLLKKEEGKGKVTGPGWAIDGQFYKTNAIEQNRTFTAIKTTPYLADNYLITEPEIIEKNTNLIKSNRAVAIDPKSLGNLGKEFNRIFKAE